MSQSKKIVVIGGGAAGFFGAIACANADSSHEVILLEKNRQVLSKVRVSGGGRCNVTHACYDPALLVKNYPRGGKALHGPFTRFQPRDTVEWFESRGVPLKAESDGRIFPMTDKSETIIHCLTQEAHARHVKVKTETGVASIAQDKDGFAVHLSDQSTLECDCLLIATGSSPKTFEWLKSLGHSIEPPVPSLFTFNVPTSPLLDLAGISVPRAHVKIEDTSLEQTGPLLITHWGFSGPAVLKLSAWGARILHDLAYKALLKINWLPDIRHEELTQILLECKNQYPARQIANESPVNLPKNLWKKLVDLASISSEQRWSSLSKKNLQELIHYLTSHPFTIEGKSTYKEEFVTCGGVKLDEVNFKTMESRLCPGLYFAGEVLDIDGITGGFNFQSAWTTSWIAGHAIALT
jgi:predicted Rossmann fold flavoprotein